MIKYTLNCKNGHQFDSWFSDSDSFEKLKKKEQIYGFDQATGNGPFFRKGIVGDWKNNLDKEIVSKIEEEFESEMKELGYLS